MKDLSRSSSPNSFIVKKNLLMLFVLMATVLCSSCHSNKAQKQKLVEKHTIVIELGKMKQSGRISTADFNQVRQNVISHEQRGFFSKIGWGVVMVATLLIIFAITYNFAKSKDTDAMIKPMSLKEGLLAGYLFGIFGNHYLYTKTCKWYYYSFWFLLACGTLAGYSKYMYFYNVPSLLFIHSMNDIHNPELGFYYICQFGIIIFMIFNLLSGIICTPYWVYRFNALYFRRNEEWNNILTGKTTGTDLFYNEILVPHIHEVSSDTKEANTVLNDDSLIIENSSDKEISGVIKSVFTLGRSGKLKHKVQRLRALYKCCNVLKGDISMLDEDNNILYSFLTKYRYAAYRNLYLAKELIGMIKDNISTKQQQLLLDKFPEIDKPVYHTGDGIDFNAREVAFDSDTFYTAVSFSIDNSLKRLGTKLESGDLTKDDVLLEAASSAIDTVIAGIAGIFDLNSRVSESLREVAKKTEEAEKYIGKSISSIMNASNEMLRESEIMIALYNCNKAFVHAYDPIREKIFGRPSLGQFIMGVKKDVNFIRSEEFEKDLLHLIKVCTEYNKVNEAKTGRDSYTKSQTKSKQHTNISNDSQSKIQSPNESNATQSAREDVLFMIGEVLDKSNISEGNSIAYLALENRMQDVVILSKKLSEYSGREISASKILNCNNVKEIINMVVYE